MAGCSHLLTARPPTNHHLLTSPQRHSCHPTSKGCSSFTKSTKSYNTCPTPLITSTAWFSMAKAQKHF